MKKIRAFIIFALLPLLGGYAYASHLHMQKSHPNSSLGFNTDAILPTDRITFAEKGSIISLTQTGASAIPTGHAQLIEGSPIGGNFVGVDKQTNYSSLDEFSPSGSLINTLLNGNTGDIDTMDWFTDPAVSPNMQELALVSDKNKDVTNVYDNALFIEKLSNSHLQKIADPIPGSGGIAHPVWDPANADILTYDYYEYDQNYNPYSVIDEYNLSTQATSLLTTRQQNAYQGSFSPDGKYFIFLERNNNITAVMYLANVTANGLSGAHSIASGDFAYPEFSRTANHIYYLAAQDNSDYDLYTAELKNGVLTAITPISTDEQLLGNSGFTVTNK
jgi:hypothetical protein